MCVGSWMETALLTTTSLGRGLSERSCSGLVVCEAWLSLGVYWQAVEFQPADNTTTAHLPVTVRLQNLSTQVNRRIAATAHAIVNRFGHGQPY